MEKKTKLKMFINYLFMLDGMGWEMKAVHKTEVS